MASLAAHNPASGFHGEELSIDYAWFGASDAPKVLVLISGTHGAEGFCGSGCQVGWLSEGEFREFYLKILQCSPFLELTVRVFVVAPDQ